MAIDAKLVKELREKTGLPMMECKRALQETDGDVEVAYTNLRKAGLKAVEKLAGREASDGLVGSQLSDDGKSGVLVALRCETESVAKNETFQEFLRHLTAVVDAANPDSAESLKSSKLPSGETVGDGITELVNQIRENITLGRFARFGADAVVQYVHFDNKKAAMVALEGGSTSDAKVAELGKNLSMHIVFTKPKALSRDQLDPAIIEREREIFLERMKADPKNAKKPEEILKKIIQGQIDKFISEQCLLEQPYVHDEKQTVEQAIKSSGTGVKLVDYIYVATDVD